MTEVDPSRDVLAQLDTLVEQHRRAPSAELAEQLLSLRLAAVSALDGVTTSPAPIPDDPFPDVDGLPEVDAADLDVHTLAGALGHHGALLVRKVLDAEQIDLLRADLDRLIRAAGGDDAADAVYGGSGNQQTTESPEALAHQIDAFHDAGLVDTISGYLGGRPIAITDRVRLRRTHRGGLPWHQDAAFYGGTFRAVNAWVALTPCGVDRDGLVVVPRHTDEIVGFGGEHEGFAYGAKTFTPKIIARLSAGRAPVAPVFAAGDALLFDEMTVHRTKVVRDAVAPREAAIIWFFAPDRVPERDHPLPWVKLVV